MSNDVLGRIVAVPHLRTDRLELRALGFDDLDELAAMLGDGEGLIHWGPRSAGRSRARGSSGT